MLLQQEKLQKNNIGENIPFTKAGEYLLNNRIGPKEIHRLLRENKIKVKKEKVFEECKNKNCLPFDFFCTDTDEDGEYFWWVVEYDGKQHFAITHKFTPDANALRHRKYLDRIKNTFCFKEYLPIIRIPYYVTELTIADLMPSTSKYLLESNKDVQKYYKEEREYRGKNEIHRVQKRIHHVPKLNARRVCRDNRKADIRGRG
jgi:hypothetical protein